MYTTCITSICDGQTLPVRGAVNASALSADTYPFHCYSTIWFYVMFCHFHNLRGTETQTRNIHRTLLLKTELRDRTRRFVNENQIEAIISANDCRNRREARYGTD